MAAFVTLALGVPGQAGLLAQTPGQQEQKPEQKAEQKSEKVQAERFRAFVANLGTVETSADRRPVEFQISRWTTDEEEKQLFDVLQQKGPKAMLDTLQRLDKVGWIRSQGGLSHELRYARQKPAEGGGRQITLMTDRIIGFWELAGSARSKDYPFTVIQLTLDGNGKGEGTMMVATKIEVQAGVLVFEDLSSAPARLLSVTKEK